MRDEESGIEFQLGNQSPIQTQRDMWAAKYGALSRDNHKITFNATCDGHVVMDINLNDDYDTIINLTNVVKEHFVNSPDATEVIITITRKN